MSNLKEAVKEYVESFSWKRGTDYSQKYCHDAFIAGAEWQKQQTRWRNFKDERPKPGSYILRRMIHPSYQSYGKVIYYADFWGEDRPDKWEQDNDKVVYEWQYINE